MKSAVDSCSTKEMSDNGGYYYILSKQANNTCHHVNILTYKYLIIIIAPFVTVTDTVFTKTRAFSFITKKCDAKYFRFISSQIVIYKLWVHTIDRKRNVVEKNT